MEKKLPTFQKKKVLHSQNDTVKNVVLSAIAATSVMSAQMAVASEAYTAPTSNVTASELSGSVQLDSLSETVLPTQAELNAPRVLNLEPTQNNILFAAHYSHVSHASHSSHTSHYSCTPGVTC
jgi:hypothetical protein